MALTDLLLDRNLNKERWEAYLNERRGTYEFRCQRYSAVAEVMIGGGLHMDDDIVDVGAGRLEFERYMRSIGWNGRYTPIDGSIDGTDINHWVPGPATWFVAIELLEHLDNPFRLMIQMSQQAFKGVVITTPNPAVVDVLAIDPTHVTPIPAEAFASRSWEHSIRSFFSKPHDSILAWKLP